MQQLRRQPEFRQLADEISRLTPGQRAWLWYRLEDEQLLRNPELRESLEQMHCGEFAPPLAGSEAEAAAAREITGQA